MGNEETFNDTNVYTAELSFKESGDRSANIWIFGKTTCGENKPWHNSRNKRNEVSHGFKNV